MKKKVLKIIGNILLVILILLSILLLIRNTCFMAIVVSGNSMTPTLKSNEYGYANKTKMAIDNIERFDIIVFEVDNGESKTGLIKRVIGLPGETLEFKGENCDLYVNNVFVEQDFIDISVQKLTANNLNYEFKLDTPIVLDENNYLVLGDNRGISHDSLHGLGLIEKEQIEGVLFLICGNCESIEQEDDSIVCEGKNIGAVRFF